MSHLHGLLPLTLLFSMAFTGNGTCSCISQDRALVHPVHLRAAQTLPLRSSRGLQVLVRLTCYAHPAAVYNAQERSKRWHDPNVFDAPLTALGKTQCSLVCGEACS